MGISNGSSNTSLIGSNVSVYAYVQGNPLSYRDPTGLVSAADEACAMGIIPAVQTSSTTAACSGGGVPRSPPGVSLRNNLDLFGGSSIWDLSMDWMGRDLTIRGGPWDYNTNNGAQYDDFGNFNYGAISAEMGLPYYVAQNLAGFYNGSSIHDGIPLLVWPHGDDTQGALQIQAGHHYVSGP
jgi:hypothetical protein